MERQTSYIISQTIFPAELFRQLFKKSEVFSFRELRNGDIKILFNRNKLLKGRDPNLVAKALSSLDKVANPALLLEALANYTQEGYIEWGINVYNNAFPYAMLFYSYSIAHSLWKKNHFEAVSNTALFTLGLIVNYYSRTASFNSGIKKYLSVLAEKLNNLIEEGSVRENLEVSSPSETSEMQSLAVKDKLEQSSTTTMISKSVFFKPGEKSDTLCDESSALCKEPSDENRPILLGNR